MRFALLVAAAVLALPGVATAQFIERADRIELANQLAEAFEEQNVCYAWDINGDIGSSFGPDKPFRAGDTCRDYVEFTASVVYTCDTCESEDSASFRVSSSFDFDFEGDLKKLGYDSGDLLSEEDDVAAINMIGALPAIVADRANLPAVPFEPTGLSGGAEGVPTDRPGSDLIREQRWTLGLGLLCLVGGLGWWFAQRRGHLQSGATPAEHD